MSWQATNWASKQDVGGVGGKCLLYALANYADMAGRCWPSQRRLCDDTEMSERSVRDWLMKLEERELIEVVERRRGDGTRRADIIILKMGSDAGNQEGYDGDDPLPKQPATAAGCSTGKSSGSKRQTSTHQPANSAAPIENNQSEHLVEEPERDAHAREASEKLPHVGGFNRKWPTASSDDQRRTKAAWDALILDERQACLDGIEPFLKKSKADGRGHVIAGWRYIEERRWTLLPQPVAGAAAAIKSIKSWSREWWATLLRKIYLGKPTDLMLRWAMAGYECPADEAITQADVDALHGFPSDGEAVAAWRPWFEARRLRLPEWKQRCWIYLPAAHPPSAQSPPPSDQELSEFK